MSYTTNHSAPHTRFWHVSPVVDVCAYAFSWVWIWIPLLLSGPDKRHDYLGWYLVILLINEAHRHLTLPYVYLNTHIRRLFFRRITYVPLLLLMVWFASPFVSRIRIPGSSFSPRMFLNGIAVAAALWNIAHVYMQKYGLLRMYQAKHVSIKKTPPWADKLLVFCWVPLYFAWLGPKSTPLLSKHFYKGAPFLKPVMAFFEAQQRLLVPLCMLFIVFSMGVFVFFEVQKKAPLCMPRFFMALGTTLLSSLFIYTDPVKAYLSFGFSHSIEYMVFVFFFWKSQHEKKYTHVSFFKTTCTVLCLLGTYLCFFSAAYFYGRYFGNHNKKPIFLGFHTHEWVGYWIVYQSMVHFYFDGFLWKIKNPKVFEHL